MAVPDKSRTPARNVVLYVRSSLPRYTIVPTPRIPTGDEHRTVDTGQPQKFCNAVDIHVRQTVLLAAFSASGVSRACACMWIAMGWTENGHLSCRTRCQPDRLQSLLLCTDNAVSMLAS